MAAGSVLVPAAVLPEQFHDARLKADPARGEVALMRAVLDDAIACFQKCGGPAMLRHAREAELWFFVNDYAWPFSFVNICAVLGLDAGYLRLGLQRWRQSRGGATRKRRRSAPARSFRLVAQ
jgi:hypothetical protein